MRSTCDEDLVRKLPMPLAQLYRRADNAKTPMERHLTAFYLWEASVKLLASVAIVAWTERGERDPAIDERLQNLARPSLGHWWEFARRLVGALAPGDPSFGAAHDVLLGKAQHDLPRAAALDAVLGDVLEGKGQARSTVRVQQLFDRLITYRNRELGHGAGGRRPGEFHERVGAALLLGTAEILGRIDVLAGRRLVHVGDVRRQGSGGWLVERFDLTGEVARRVESLEWDDAAGLPRPDRLYLQAADDPRRLTALHPLLVHEHDTGEVLFLNARRGRGRTEYLCYTTGRTLDRELESEQRELLAGVLGLPTEAVSLEEWASRAAEPATDGEGPDPGDGKRIGEFEIVSELGRGGMGVVYRAWQPSLGRQVALKVLLRAGDPKAETRFAREIRSLARVEHPNLVRVFTSGADGDQWYFAMELVEGASLADICEALAGRAVAPASVDRRTWQDALTTAAEAVRSAERPIGEAMALAPVPRVRREVAALESPALPGVDYVRHVVELVRQIATAVDALHEVGVIHRDIKPGNIVVTSDGRQAVLLDLGLAQLADDVHGKLTRTRQFVGTLRYASPEQILAVGDLDRRSDVYSLGATLWELLTLRPLHGGGEDLPTPELMTRIQYEDAEPIRNHNPQVSADLDAIVARCLEKDRNRRYVTARELAEDLRAWLDGEPVLANVSNTRRMLAVLTRETRHTEVLVRWGHVWMRHAAVAFVLFLATHVLLWQGVTQLWVFLALWFPGALALAFIWYWYRVRGGLRFTSLERQIAQIWVQFFFVSLLTGAIGWQLGLQAEILPVLFLECSLSFGAMASLLGGSFYGLTFVCLLSAVTLSIWPDRGLAVLGALFSLALFLPGWRYARLGDPRAETG